MLQLSAWVSLRALSISTHSHLSLLLAILNDADQPSRSLTCLRSHCCSQPENCISTYKPHAYCVVYSTTDRASVRIAEEVLQSLWRSDHVSARAVILVGNKVDLVRSRLVSTEGDDIFSQSGPRREPASSRPACRHARGTPESRNWLSRGTTREGWKARALNERRPFYLSLRGGV